MAEGLWDSSYAAVKTQAELCGADGGDWGLGRMEGRNA